MPTPPDPTPQPLSAPSPLDVLPQALRRHHQKEDASCAVSGQECIAKLHGFIAPDEFPLQSDPANQKKGFGRDDRKFLESYKIDGKDNFYDVPAAMVQIETETKAGRFPLISLVGKDRDGNWVYHTYLCAQHEKELLLIDPATPAIPRKGAANLRAWLENNSAINPERKTIHVLTYTLPSAPAKA